MNRSPLVSVVMPVYNGEQYLHEAVESILGQSLKNFEFIIVDDGSTDRSPKILNRYQGLDARIRVLRRTNKGIAASLNAGIEACRGKYIARMDSDDISLPHRLARQTAFMESRPEVGICGTACRYFGDHSGVGRPLADSEKIRSMLLFSPVMIHPTVMMRRELMLRYDLRYRTDFEEGEDYELWLRFSQCCRMANMRQALVLVRMHDDQKHRRFDKYQDRWGNIVRTDAIRALGVEPSDEDIILHQTLCRANYQRSREYLERVENWFCRLLDANQSSHVLDRDALARVLFPRWFSSCAAASELGMWTWRKYRKSPLSSGMYPPVRNWVTFGVKCLLRKRQLRRRR